MRVLWVSCLVLVVTVFFLSAFAALAACCIYVQPVLVFCWPSDPTPIRLDSGRTGASMAWKETEWKTWKTYLGTNKEVFGAELYAIGEALGIALRDGKIGRGSSSQSPTTRWTKIHIWADSQAAIKRLQHTAPGAGQWLARRIIARTQQLKERDTTVEIHWVPGQKGVEGNERADEAAKAAAEAVGVRRCPERFTSLAHIGRTVTERKWKKAQHWFQKKHENRTHIHRARYEPTLDTQGPDETAMYGNARVARRYFQLKSGHAVTGSFLKRVGKRPNNEC